MLAQMPGAGEIAGNLLDVERVDVTRKLRAEGDVRSGGRRRIGYRHRRLIAADQRSARSGDMGILQIGFGREHVGPVAEHLAEIALDIAIVEIPVAVRADLRRAAGRHGLEFLGLAVAKHRAVLVVDVPVDLGEIAFVGQVGERLVAGVETELLRLAENAVVERGVDALHRRGASGDRVARSRRSGVADALALFVAQEEEQSVLDDRAADGEARGSLALPAVIRAVRIAADGAPVIVARPLPFKPNGSPALTLSTMMQL